MGYLDEEGLERVWDKIDNKFTVLKKNITHLEDNVAENNQKIDDFDKTVNGIIDDDTPSEKHVYSSEKTEALVSGIIDDEKISEDKTYSSYQIEKMIEEGGSGDTGVVISKEDYDKLPESERTNGTVYYTYDDPADTEGTDARSKIKKYYMEDEYKIYSAKLAEDPVRSGIYLIDKNVGYTFVHLTDLHMPATNTQAASDCIEIPFEIAKDVGADAVLCTGDYVYKTSNQDFDTFVNTVNKYNTPMMLCIGNHDVASYNNSQAYNKYIKPFYNRYNWIMPTSKYGEQPTFFKKTFEKTEQYNNYTNRLVVISLNQFIYRGDEYWDNHNHDASYTYVHWSQEEVDWLCDTLKSLPSGTGVIIMLHTPEYGYDMTNSEYNKFCQNKSRDVAYASMNWGAMPVYSIVDAFIKRTSLKKTFNNNSGVDGIKDGGSQVAANPSSITVDVDFSNVDKDTEFICYLGGHIHQDAVHYVKTGERGNINITTKQLFLCETCTSMSASINFGADLPRVADTNTRHAFNVYSIDRKNKLVKIVRIGSKYSYDMRVRDVMSIPYK